YSGSAGRRGSYGAIWDLHRAGWSHYDGRCRGQRPLSRLLASGRLRVVAHWSDPAKAGGLGTARALIGRNRQLDRVPHTEVLEFLLDHGVPVEVNAAAVVDLDEAVALIMKDV